MAALCEDREDETASQNVSDALRALLEGAVDYAGLYPPAPAYFEFACPFGDCDGSFDLNGVASPLLKKAHPHADGSIQCSGSRTRAGLPRQPCSLRADYRITAQYQTSSARKG